MKRRPLFYDVRMVGDDRWFFYAAGKVQYICKWIREMVMDDIRITRKLFKCAKSSERKTSGSNEYVLFHLMDAISIHFYGALAWLLAERYNVIADADGRALFAQCMNKLLNAADAIGQRGFIYVYNAYLAAQSLAPPCSSDLTSTASLNTAHIS